MSTAKEEQKQNLIDLMKTDEEFGMYNTPIINQLEETITDWLKSGDENATNLAYQIFFKHLDRKPEEVTKNIDELKQSVIDFLLSKPDAPFVSSSERSFSSHELANEIQNDTDFGKDQINQIVILTVDRILRNKEKIPPTPTNRKETKKQLMDAIQRADEKFNAEYSKHKVTSTEQLMVNAGTPASKEKPDFDSLIHKHLHKFTEQNLFRASLLYFVESGKLSGSFKSALIDMVKDHVEPEHRRAEYWEDAHGRLEEKLKGEIAALQEEIRQLKNKQ